MKIFVTGGTGFIGSYLTKSFIDEGHFVTILKPGSEKLPFRMKGLSYLEGNPTMGGEWQKAVADHDVIVNLAGASIFNRWTQEYKNVLRSSRMLTTRRLVEALPEKAGDVTFFSASAVGYYGFHEDEELAESSPAGADFLARLAEDWENEAFTAEQKGARLIRTRFGIVLGKNGGALGQMIPLFNFLLGGPLGSGRQWFSWIHLHDLAAAFNFLLGKKEISGAINICSPHPVRNKELAQALGKALRRPSFMPAPAFMIRLILGEFGSVLLEGQRAIPRRLLEAGFLFRYPSIEEALQNIIRD